MVARSSVVYPTHGSRDRGIFAVRFHAQSANRKLSPITHENYDGPGNRKKRPVPAPPFVSATYASIAATCSDRCRFRDGGCFVLSGFNGRSNRQLDRIAKDEQLSGLDVALQEAELIRRAFGRGQIPQDGARGGRDLRLHVGGDIYGPTAARVLARAAAQWLRRGGGRVWTYTHAWEALRPEDVAPIACLASVEDADDALAAVKDGWVPALTVASFGGRRRRFQVKGRTAGPVRLRKAGWSFIPCPAETSGSNCAECRLCFDTDKLRERKTGIAFAVHGMGKDRVRLPVVVS